MRGRCDPRVHKFYTPDRPGDSILYTGASSLSDLSMELVSCHTSSTYNFKVAPRFLENLWIPFPAHEYREKKSPVYSGEEPQGPYCVEVPHNAFMLRSFIKHRNNSTFTYEQYQDITIKKATTTVTLVLIRH